MFHVRSPSIVDKHIGELVKEQRVVQKLTQNALATRLGITFQQVQKYERGTNRIGASRIYLLSQILGVEVGYFFPRLTDTPASARGSVLEQQQTISTFIESEEGQTLNSLMAKIDSPATRKSIVVLARSLTEPDEETEVVGFTKYSV